ncbi:MAG: nucleoside phosphorylase, partial [Euryarchaeota archaeon]|nr:nucleoside phosphorylase [Euryarchaeota archaeon]
LIRIGTTGTIQKNIKIGDLIISTAAVRLEGTSKQYVIPEYPAVASYDVVVALIAAAESLGVRYHVGITASTDSFYVGQQRPGYKNYLPSFARNIIEDLRMANVLNFEMEAATLFTLASIFGLRAGAVSLVLANRVTNEFELVPQDDLIKVGLEAVKILNEMDESKEGRYWYPKELVKKGID